MAQLRFIARVALLCNCCFLFTLVMGRVPESGAGSLVAILVIMGQVVSLVMNILLHGLLALGLLGGRRPEKALPRWLLLANLILFGVQLNFLFR